MDYEDDRTIGERIKDMMKCIILLIVGILACIILFPFTICKAIEIKKESNKVKRHEKWFAGLSEEQKIRSSIPLINGLSFDESYRAYSKDSVLVTFPIQRTFNGTEFVDKKIAGDIVVNSYADLKLLREFYLKDRIEFTETPLLSHDKFEHEFYKIVETRDNPKTYTEWAVFNETFRYDMGAVAKSCYTSLSQ